MRKMMVVAGILLAAGSLLIPIISPAILMAGEIGCGTAVVTAVPHLNIRPLTCQEQRAVDRFLAKHSRGGLSAENYSALRSALVTLLGIDQSHLPLTRTPAAYLVDYQTVTQLLDRTVWKVKLPEAEKPCSPPPAQTPVTVNVTVTGGGQSSSAPLSAPLPVITGGQTIYTNTVMTAGWCSGGGSRTNITVTAQGGAGAAAAAASSSSSSTSSSTTPTSGASANNGSGSSSGAASP